MRYKILYNKGFSLIELSITLVVIGMLVAVSAKILPKFFQEINEQKVINNNQVAEDAILGFIYSYSRLPCPAIDSSGVENCTQTKGFFPYKTVGYAAPLKNQAGLDLRYAVFSRPNSTPALDLDLKALKDRAEPFITMDTTSTNPVGQKQVLNTGAPNALDFCAVLQAGSKISAVDTSALRVGTLDTLENVAYVLHDLGVADASGDNTLADGLNSDNVASLAYNQSSDAGDALNDDSIQLKFFNDLWGDLGCSSVVAAASHAHPNAATSAAIMAQNLDDYEKQVDLLDDIAAINVLVGAAKVTQVAAEIATNAAKVPIAVAAGIESLGTLSAAAVTAGLAVAASAAASLVAVAKAAIAVTNKLHTADRLTEAQAMETEASTLNTSVNNNAVAADNAGLYTR